MLGGGTKILKPEIMYEIDVPTKVGQYIFPISSNRLLIDSKAFSQFYLGLNSTNKQILENGATIYPQLQYQLNILFDFGKAGSVHIDNIRVLL